MDEKPTDLERLKQRASKVRFITDAMAGRSATVGDVLPDDVVVSVLRVVLREMREPSPELLNAGVDGLALAWEAGIRHMAKHGWQAMIDKILDEGDKP